MLANIFSSGLDLLAWVVPISIAATNIVFFPLAALWLFAAPETFLRWPPVWGWPERCFLIFLGVSLVSALAGINPLHSLREIKNKDFYLLIAIVLAAIVRDREKNGRLLRIFMISSLLMAVWGLIQYGVGVDQTDKHEGYFVHLPAALAHWPRPVLDEFSLLNGRIMGTRGHPLAYAECLLFNLSLALCFLLSCRAKDVKGWILYVMVVGAAFIGSQSRGPWIAFAVVTLAAIALSRVRRSWILAGLGVAGLVVFAMTPFLRQRLVSILDKTHHSNVEREHMWHAGWQLWKANPILGIGPGNVKGVSPAFQTVDEKKWGPWGHLHSIYVNFLVERGALGLAAFFLFIGSLMWELWRALEKAMNDAWLQAVYRGTLLGLVGFLISGFTETLYNTAVVMMTFYFVVGIALSLARHEEPAASS